LLGASATRHCIVFIRGMASVAPFALLQILHEQLPLPFAFVFGLSTPLRGSYLGRLHFQDPAPHTANLHLLTSGRFLAAEFFKRKLNQLDVLHAGL